LSHLMIMLFLYSHHPSGARRHDDAPMDDDVLDADDDEELVANNNHEMSDYDEDDDNEGNDDLDDEEYSSPTSVSELPSRYGHYRPELVVVSEPLSLVVDRTAPNAALAAAESAIYMRPLVTARPRTPVEDEDSYFYERPPRNADSAPPSLASIL